MKKFKVCGWALGAGPSAARNDKNQSQMCHLTNIKVDKNILINLKRLKITFEKRWVDDRTSKITKNFDLKTLLKKMYKFNKIIKV